MTAARRIPVHVLTGFLGSGKTTLLRHLLAGDGFADTAVIINEFGEVGLDHHLARRAEGDVVLLDSGCLCCALRDDLVSTLARLLRLAEAGEVPAFSRVVVETTGIADPMPICEAVLSDRRLGGYRLGEVVTAVDPLTASATFAGEPVAAGQVAAADRLVLTKADLATPDELAAMQTQLMAMNGGADIVTSSATALPPAAALFDDSAASQRRFTAVTTDGSPHAGISTFGIDLDSPVDWDRFVAWLDLLLGARGSQLLRLKGVLAVTGRDRPLVIQCVRHVVHAPRELESWPAGKGHSHLTFIAHDLTRSAVQGSLRDWFGTAVAA